MTFEQLRDAVCRANARLAEAGLVSLAFGNASAVDRDRGVFLIKPSGLACDAVRPGDLVVVGIDDDRVVEGPLRPSSDTPTHALLYRRFPAIGGVVHTHSPFASAWAQAGRPIPALGTTHADHFDGPVPVTAPMTPTQIGGAYERETGEVIAATIEQLGIDPLGVPATLVAGHGPFTWGATVDEAVTSAVALEVVAAMAYRTLALAPGAAAIDDALLNRHFHRKHGPAATYGQVTDEDLARRR